MSQKDTWNNLRKKTRRGHHWRASTPKLDIKWGAQKLPDERGYAKQFSSVLSTEISHREILLFFPSPLKSNFIYERIVSGLFLVTFIVGFAFNLTTGGIGTIEFLLIFLKNHKKKSKEKKIWKFFRTVLRNLSNLMIFFLVIFLAFSIRTLASVSVTSELGLF